MSGSTALTPEAKSKGRDALIRTFDTDYEDGPSSLRSFENEEIESLAATLFKARTIDDLLAMKIMAVDLLKAFFPEEKIRHQFVSNAIDNYVRAACGELNVPCPELGKKIS